LIILLHYDTININK